MVALGEQTPGGEESQCTDRQIDIEDPPPAQRLGQDSADGWPHAYTQRQEDHVEAERPAALGGRERARDHGNVDAKDGGRTQALEAARGDECA